MQTARTEDKQLTKKPEIRRKQVVQEAKKSARDMNQQQTQTNQTGGTDQPTDTGTTNTGTNDQQQGQTGGTDQNTTPGTGGTDQNTNPGPGGTDQTTTSKLPAYNSSWDAKYAAQFGNMDPETLTTAAWTNLAAGDVEATVACALKCINLYAQQATETGDEGLINHVGTAYFILGQALEKAGDTAGAAEAYQTQISQFANAQAYDPGSASWWSVTTASQEKLQALGGGLTQQKTEAADTAAAQQADTNPAVTDTTTNRDTDTQAASGTVVDTQVQQADDINKQATEQTAQVDQDLASQQQATADATNNDIGLVKVEGTR